MTSQLRAAGRVILVSGATRGIGQAIATVLHDRGYTLSLGARSPARLAPLIEGMDPDRALCHPYEATQPSSAASWVDATVARYGRVDGVVAGAGVLNPFDVETGDEDLLDEMWDVNVKGPWRLARAAMPLLRESGHGRLVVLASLAAKRATQSQLLGYAMTKRAVLALTHGVRLSGWDDGVRATAICPGLVDTDMTSTLGTIEREGMTSPETVAELVALALALPNNASVAELVVNCLKEPAW